MEVLQTVSVAIGIIIGLLSIAATIWKLGKRFIERISKPVKCIEQKVEELSEKVGEVIEASGHSRNANRQLLEVRIKQHCYEVFEYTKRTGKEEVGESTLALINGMYEEWKFFGGNGGGVVDRLVERVNALHIVED